MPTTLYTRRAESKGWLAVQLPKKNLRVFLPEYTKVTVTRQEGDVTYFTIDDGFIATGEEACLTRGNGAKFLSPIGPGGAATLSVEYMGTPANEVSPFKGPLKQQWARLNFAGQVVTVTLNSVWGGQYTPIPPGVHTILAPDASHANIPTSGYAAVTPNMVGNDVWFPIGLGGSMANSSRYVHVGHLSEGCVTVHQLERWTAVYQYLISHRVPGSGGKRIGSLVVRK